MALFDTKDALHKHGIDAVFLGGYAWREVDTRGRGEPGLRGVGFDSLGMFALEPVSTFKRLVTVPMLLGTADNKLDQYESKHAAQGYPAHAYVGVESKVLDAYADPNPHTHDGGERLPHIVQKRLIPEVWDAYGALMGHGAHQPLLFYMGDRPRRTPEGLARREENMNQRGWGPGSTNRFNFMERGGKNKGKDKGKGKDIDKGKGKGKGDIDKGKGKSVTPAAP